MPVNATYKSDDPVSKSKFNCVEPMVTGHRYSASYCSGLAVTVPSLFAAAAAMTAGTALPYLA